MVQPVGPGRGRAVNYIYPPRFQFVFLHRRGLRVQARRRLVRSMLHIIAAAFVAVILQLSDFLAGKELF